MKRVPVGVEDFKRVVDEDYYYVDKSMFIKEVMQEVGTMSRFRTHLIDTFFLFETSFILVR